ncbi:MAG: energy transducer TonB [Mucilaginibacter sp.]
MPKLVRYLVLLIFIPAFSYSQELKMVEEHPYENVFEHYQVLAASPNIRHGFYQRFLTASLKLVEEGYYKNGLKDGIWTNYNILGDTTEKITYANGMKNGYSKKWLFPFGNAVVIREGNYGDDKRTGVWTFRKPDHNMDHKYDYSSGRVVEYGKSDNASTIIDGKDTITAILEKPPVHIGGMDTLYEILAKNIRMPIDVKRDMRNNLHYRVFVSFLVNEYGRLENFAIERGTNKVCNDEALRVIKLWDDGNWEAGQYNGHAVKVKILTPIVFNKKVDDYGTQTILNANGFH